MDSSFALVQRKFSLPGTFSSPVDRFHRACKAGQVDLIREYCTSDLKYEVLNSTNNNLKWTPLVRSILARQITITKILLAAGADPEIKSADGETAIFQACKIQSSTMLELLARYKVLINVENLNGDYPLHITSLHGNKMLCKLLLIKGADPNVQNKFSKNTPLHIAIERGHMDCAMILFKYGAMGDILNKNGQTPLSLATKLDKIKLDHYFAYQRKSKSVVRPEHRGSSTSLIDCDISCISLQKVSNCESGMSSPSLSHCTSKFLYSTINTKNPEERQENLSKIEESKEDSSEVTQQPPRWEERQGILEIQPSKRSRFNGKESLSKQMLHEFQPHQTPQNLNRSYIKIDENDINKSQIALQTDPELMNKNGLTTREDLPDSFHCNQSLDKLNDKLKLVLKEEVTQNQNTPEKTPIFDNGGFNFTLGFGQTAQFNPKMSDTKIISQGDTFEQTKTYDTKSFEMSPHRNSGIQNFKDISGVSLIEPDLAPVSDSDESAEFEEWEQFDERIAYNTQERNLLSSIDHNILQKPDPDFQGKKIPFSRSSYNSTETPFNRYKRACVNSINRSNMVIKDPEITNDYITIHKIPDTPECKLNLFGKSHKAKCPERLYSTHSHKIPSRANQSYDCEPTKRGTNFMERKPPIYTQDSSLNLTNLSRIITEKACSKFSCSPEQNSEEYELNIVNDHHAEQPIDTERTDVSEHERAKPLHQSHIKRAGTKCKVTQNLRQRRTSHLIPDSACISGMREGKIRPSAALPFNKKFEYYLKN
ncbi:unnamed protein product [Moneuplotes crassus]|uniref:Uncharacterized protein n=1 Tax=Euplotes crassus TaxID=5936 RepID=A0AAD1Y6Z5_EUPCR|nr:unnamed protein product [Moneuplotes crassus]